MFINIRNSEPSYYPIKMEYFDDDKVYFKFATTGLVPMNTERSMWFNTDQHVHAVVNDSTTARQIISISGDAEWPL